MRIPITDRISIDDSEIKEEFVRSSGPGGQNVNKVATSVQLRFDAGHSPSLPADVRARLASIAGKRMTDEGVLIVSASRFRTQERNRLDAMARLADLIRQASRRPKPRRQTKPTLSSKLKRLESKARRSKTKRLRGIRGLTE